MFDESRSKYRQSGRASTGQTGRPRCFPPLVALALSTVTTFGGASPLSHVSAQAPDARQVLVDAVVIGNLADVDSVEAFRFSLAALERIAVTVLPPADGAIAVRVAHADGGLLAAVAHPAIGASWAWIGQLPPGTYDVEIRNAVMSGGEYRLGIERLDPFAISQDQEPNDTSGLARPVPVFLAISGKRDADSDIDWYRIDPLVAPTALTLVTGGAIGGIRISDGAREYPTIADASSGTIRTVMLPAGPPLYLEVVPDGAYDIRFESGVPTPSGRPIPARLFEAEAWLTTTSSVVAAEWPDAQRLPGVFTLLNEDRNDKEIGLDALTSDLAWTVEIDHPPPLLGGSGTLEVPVVIVVPPLARADVPVRTTIRVRGRDGSQTTGFVDVTPVHGVPPVSE